MTDARSGRSIAVIIGLLIVSNVVANLVLPSWASVPWNVAIATILVVVALRNGISFATLDVDGPSLRRGWRVGRWFLVGAVAFYGLALLVPTTREWLEDDRVASLGWGAVTYHAFVAVPLGTVLLEEVAFRGLLPTIGERLTTRARAVAIACVLFGLWHVLPAWEINEVNPGVRDLLGGTAGRAVAVSLGVVTSALIGFVFCWLRFRTRSLLTPMLWHIATNSVAYIASFIAWSLAR